MDLLKSLPMFFKWRGICIDNIVFRLHYQVTSLLLLALSFVLSSKQYFGEPITCMSNAAIPEKTLNNYCWIYSTFTVRKHISGGLRGGAAHPGVGSYVSSEDDVIQHKYYQWVSFVLLCQALMFYLPRYLWKRMEGGLVRMLTADIMDCSFMSQSWSEERKTKMADFITDSHVHHHHHAVYALKFFLAEIMNFANVVLQMCLLNKFLGGEFFNYGPNIAENFRHTTSEDVMSRVFPKVTKCTFHDYGTSGNIQVKDALCVLPLNIFNERIFVLLWFWFTALAIVSALALAYRAALACKLVRVHALAYHAHFVDRDTIRLVVDRCSFGDWFLTSLLAKNLNPVMFKEFILAIAKNLEEKKAESKSKGKECLDVAPLGLVHKESGKSFLGGSGDFKREITIREEMYSLLPPNTDKSNGKETSKLMKNFNYFCSLEKINKEQSPDSNKKEMAEGDSCSVTVEESNVAGPTDNKDDDKGSNGAGVVDNIDDVDDVDGEKPESETAESVVKKNIEYTEYYV